MQTASFIGFIKALFYMIAFYYIFRFLAKIILPKELNEKYFSFIYHSAF